MCVCVLQAPCRLSWLREFGAAVPTAVHQRAEATEQAEAGLGGTAVLGAECQWGTLAVQPSLEYCRLTASSSLPPVTRSAVGCCVVIAFSCLGMPSLHHDYM